MNDLTLSAREQRSFFHTFSDLPSLAEDGAVVITGGEGPFVFDETGRRYFEGNSGLWNMTLGFSEKRLVDVATRQYAQLPGYHTFFGRNSQPSVELAERILALAPVPMSRAFFTNSGSEANESVIKLLWLMWKGEGQLQRRKLITRKNAYHGATVMASSLTGKDYVGAFGLPGPEIVTVGCPHFARFARPGETEAEFVARLASELEDRIEAEGPETIAGFWAEPIMGAGGVLVPPQGYFAAIQPILKRHGIPLVGDEVICGFGRTGLLWGADAVGQKPDIIVASKSISAGYFPMGAVMLSPEIDARASKACREWEEFPHGFTAGGHPVGCALANEAIRIITEEGVLQSVQSLAPQFEERLGRIGNHALVGEARGLGLMGAVEVVADKATRQPFPSDARIGERIARMTRERGLIIRPLGASIVIAPPFITTSEQLDWIFDTIGAVLDEIAAEGGREAA